VKLRNGRLAFRSEEIADDREEKEKMIAFYRLREQGAAREKGDLYITLAWEALELALSYAPVFDQSPGGGGGDGGSGGGDGGSAGAGGSGGSGDGGGGTGDGGGGTGGDGGGGGGPGGDGGNY
jgi:hypothetical protein